MFNPLINKRTGEAQCVGYCIEYHKLQYLKMSDSVHIWIPSWQNKKQKELQNQNKVKVTKLLSPVNAAKVVSKKLKLRELDEKIR